MPQATLSAASRRHAGIGDLEFVRMRISARILAKSSAGLTRKGRLFTSKPLRRGELFRAKFQQNSPAGIAEGQRDQDLVAGSLLKWQGDSCRHLDSRDNQWPVPDCLAEKSRNSLIEASSSIRRGKIGCCEIPGQKFAPALREPERVQELVHRPDV